VIKRIVKHKYLSSLFIASLTAIIWRYTDTTYTYYVDNADFYYHRTHHENISKGSNSFIVALHNFSVTGHLLRKGKGTIIAARKHIVYPGLNWTNTGYEYLTIYLPNINKDNGYSYNLAKDGAIVFYSTGNAYYPTKGITQSGYATKGLLTLHKYKHGVIHVVYDITLCIKLWGGYTPLTYLDKSDTCQGGEEVKLSSNKYAFEKDIQWLPWWERRPTWQKQKHKMTQDVRI